MTRSPPVYYAHSYHVKPLVEDEVPGVYPLANVKFPKSIPFPADAMVT